MLQRFIQTFAVLITSFATCAAFAQEPQITVLNFQNWKEQQILDAQNQTLRVSARLAQVKNGKSAAQKESAPLPAGSKFKKSESDTVAGAEKDLRRAQESLKAALELAMEDYVTVYLPTLRDSPEALQALAQKLSKEELAEIFKVLIRKDAPPDTKRNGAALATALSTSSRSHVP